MAVSAAIGMDVADLWDAKGNIRNEQLADLFDPNDQLKLLAADGIILEGVLLYGLARPSLQPEAARLSALPKAWLLALGEKIEALGFAVRVHH